MQSYKELEIYQLSHKLAVEIHEMSLKELPKFEMYEEGSQIRRSSKSIPTNIVEGFGSLWPVACSLWPVAWDQLWQRS